MSTNLEVITDALRGVNLIDENQTPSAEQGVKALRSLNQMLASWDDSIRFASWFTQTDLAETCPIPEYAEAGVIGKLGIKLAGDYGLNVSVEFATNAQDGYDVILRRAVNAKLQPVDVTHLPLGDHGHGRILTG